MSYTDEDEGGFEHPEVVRAMGGAAGFWAQKEKYSDKICIAVAISALVNTVLIAFTATAGRGTDWDPTVEIELGLQATNIGIAWAMKNRNHRYMRHTHTNRAIAAVLVSNVLLRVGLYVVLLIYVTAVTGANDDECEETAPDGVTCIEWEYYYDAPAQTFAAICMCTMAVDTAIFVASVLNLRAILKAKDNAQALVATAEEESGRPLKEMMAEEAAREAQEEEALG